MISSVHYSDGLSSLFAKKLDIRLFLVPRCLAQMRIYHALSLFIGGRPRLASFRQSFSPFFRQLVFADNFHSLEPFDPVAVGTEDLIQALSVFQDLEQKLSVVLDF